ncbi:MAG: SBBP repeat-containing protein [Bacteroidota bacterium]
MRLWCLLFVICLCSIVLGKKIPPPDLELKSYPSQVYFEENKGQYDPQIHYKTFVPDHLVRFLDQGISIAQVREIEARDPSREPQSEKHENYQWRYARAPEYEGLIWNVTFVNTLPDVVPKGKDMLPGYTNYLRGNDPSSWSTHVRRFRELWYDEIYKGIDLRYYGSAEHQLKYDFILQAGADMEAILMEWDGVDQLKIDEKGNLRIFTQWGEVKDMAPYAYQLIDGEEIAVPVQYVQHSKDKIGFRAPRGYNEALPLIIDPLTLTWSSFFHTSTSDDYVMSVCRDALNFVYFTGYTKVTNFPTTAGVYQNTYAGGIDAYVTKLAADGTSMMFSTYLGGSDWELAYGIGVNASFEPYVAGFCRSSNFPTTSGSVQPTSNGGLVEGFLAKLSADGSSLQYGTYVGGSDRDYLYDLEVWPTGEAFIVGYTLSSDFPTSSGAYIGGPRGNGDVFVNKYNSTGTVLEYAAMFGGSNYDIANGLAVDTDGEVFVVGNTGSTDFPATSGSIQTAANFGAAMNQEDAFIAKLNASGNAVEYITYLGGTNGDVAHSVDVNGSEEAFITGITYSSDFPTTAGAYQGAVSPVSTGDAFAARINTAGSSLVYSTYLGGSGLDYGKSIRIDTLTNVAHVLGATQSSNFPVTSGANSYVAQFDAFVSVLSANGSTLEHGNLYGGTYNDYPRASGSIFLRDDKITLGITTHSGDVPMTPGTYQISKTNGVSDAPWLVGIEVDVVLPISFSAFSARWENEKLATHLEWEIDPKNLAGHSFRIERKQLTGEWHLLGTVAGKAGQFHYTWKDLDSKTLQGETVIYRLVLIDENNETNVSQLMEVKIPPISSARLTFSPNPASDKIILTYQIPKGTQSYITIQDLAGRLIFRSPAEKAEDKPRTIEKTIPIRTWPSGTYMLGLHGSSQPTHFQKLVVTH